MSENLPYSSTTQYNQPDDPDACSTRKPYKNVIQQLLKHALKIFILKATRRERRLRTSTGLANLNKTDQLFEYT